MSRILWHSTAPWSGTGYGQQTRLFASRVRDLGHDVAISAYWGLEDHVFGWEGMTVYPGDGQYGNRSLPMYAEHHDAELVITLLDVWVLTSKKLADLPLASWVPIDHEPVPLGVRKFFERTGSRPIAMSRFGERMLQDIDLDPVYVPHGVETKILRPRPECRRETREQLGVPADAFLVLMVAANQGNAPPRKAFPQVFQAFAKLRERHPDAYMFLHTEPTGAGVKEGVSLPLLASACGLPEDSIRFTGHLQYELGMSTDDLSKLYSAADVLANPSYGEGFGVPIVEAQACGTRVLVTDCTAMSELCGDGWKVGGDPWYNAPQGAFWTCPSIAQIDAALEDAYQTRDGRPSAKARAFALQYDADRVTSEYWVPALKALGAKAPSALIAA
ncbi:MAG TPA: glycosyltransferase [Gemmatimonadales bacterium]|nr:glycosyltransferase [Gemmatimonadales bacterium]